tara:strand:- start:8685 stop:9251 length:567 start_codon:yes stop_codon:yes gene_type:complete
MSGIAQHPRPGKPVTISFDDPSASGGLDSDHDSQSDKVFGVSEKTGAGESSTLLDADALESDDWIDCKKERRETVKKRPHQIPSLGNPVERHFDSESDPSNETEHCEEQSPSIFSELTQKIEALRQKRTEARNLGRARKKRDSAEKTKPRSQYAKTARTSSHCRRNFCGGLGEGRSVRFDSSETEGEE